MEIVFTALTLLLVMDPLGNVPAFLAVLKDVPPERQRPVLFIDWPAAVSLAWKPDGGADANLRADPLDLMAQTAGFEDGETFWNALIEENGGVGDDAAVGHHHLEP